MPSPPSLAFLEFGFTHYSGSRSDTGDNTTRFIRQCSRIWLQWVDIWVRGRINETTSHVRRVTRRTDLYALFCHDHSEKPIQSLL